MAALKAPAAIHGKSSPTYVSPWSTRRKTAHETRKERPSAGTATQCARWPVARPKRALTSVPTSGRNGISQTSRDIVLFCTNPPHSSGRVRGCQGRAGVLGQFASPDLLGPRLAAELLSSKCHVLSRQRRSTYRKYASRRWLLRASSGSQLGPVPGWANLRRHTSLLGRQRRSTYRKYASRRWLPRAS